MAISTSYGLPHIPPVVKVNPPVVGEVVEAHVPPVEILCRQRFNLAATIMTTPWMVQSGQTEKIETGCRHAREDTDLATGSEGGGGAGEGGGLRAGIEPQSLLGGSYTPRRRTQRMAVYLRGLTPFASPAGQNIAGLWRVETAAALALFVPFASQRSDSSAERCSR
jgi:hypothetical protein